MTISSGARDFVERHSDVYRMQYTIAQHYMKYLEQLYNLARDLLHKENLIICDV